MNPNITSTPGTPNNTSSEDSSPSTSQTSPSYDKEGETTSDDESIVSTTSDTQLRPHAPISYNETVLKQLHGQPQVRTLKMYPYHFQVIVQKKIQTQRLLLKQMMKVNSSYKH